MTDSATQPADSAPAESAPAESAPSGGCSGCSCGSGGCGGGTQVIPELDARTIHPALRNSAIFGCLIGLLPGSAMDVVIGEDPTPLVELVEMKMPGAFTVTYLQQGPETWAFTMLRND